MLPNRPLSLAPIANQAYAINNTIAAYMMVNQAIAKKVGDGRKRPEWSFDEFVAAKKELPGILNNLVRQLKRKQDA